MYPHGVEILIWAKIYRNTEESREKKFRDLIFQEETKYLDLSPIKSRCKGQWRNKTSWIRKRINGPPKIFSLEATNVGPARIASAMPLDRQEKERIRKINEEVTEEEAGKNQQILP